MAKVYILKGTSNRYYIGSTEDFDQRIARHNTGMVHSTKRLGLPMTLIASKEFPSKSEALKVERQLKRWKNPLKAIEFLKSG